MDSINSKVIQISLLLQQAQKVRKHGIYYLEAEFTRLKNILTFCGSLILSSEQNIRSDTFDRFDSKLNEDQQFDDNRYDTPSNLQSSSAFKVPVQRGIDAPSYQGLMKQSEKAQQTLEYIELTLTAVIHIFGNSAPNCESLGLSCSKGLKLAALSLNHRLRISRLMILLNLMNNELLSGYLDHMDKHEGQNLLHLLQSLVSGSSIIDRFTFSTFEQVQYGIDTFHTILKVKRLLRENLVLMSQHICHHVQIGILLDNFFQQHTQIDLNLLLNALGIHYQLQDYPLNLLAKAFQCLLNVDEELNTVSVQEFILLTDLISLPELLLALENGEKHRVKIEDQLLSGGELGIPEISKFQLLKSFSKIEIPIIEGDDSFMWKIFTLNLIGFVGLKFDEDCYVKFENSVDEEFVETLIATTFEEEMIGKSKKSSFFKTQTKKRDPKKHLKPKKSTHDLENACFTLSRFQQYTKQRLLEITDIEIREKETHAALNLQIDSITTYKPVVHPNLVRFNEEMYLEITKEEANSVEQQYKNQSLLTNIIQKLEKCNVQSEKLSVLRKLQKQKEKKQILAERIESETTNPDPPRPLIQKKDARTSQTGISFAGSVQGHLGGRTATMPATIGEMKRMSGTMGPLSGHHEEFDRAQTQPALNQIMGQTHGAQSLMMATPHSQLSVIPDSTPNPQQASKLSEEFDIQQSLIAYLQKIKSQLLLSGERIEYLLLKADERFAKERSGLIRSLRQHDENITEKELSIRNMLTNIADREMKRNIVADELEESTLRTIEVINISDIRIEKDNLERDIAELERKQAEMERIEYELMKEKERLDEKRKKRRGGGNMAAANPGTANEKGVSSIMAQAK